MISVFVINLDRDAERLEHLDAKLIEQGVRYERVSAVWGHSLTKKQARFRSRRGRHALSPGEVGCMLSHMQAWKKAASRRGLSLVMEDDVHLCAEFSHFLKGIEKVLDPREVAIHKIDTMLASVTLSRKTNYRVNQFSAHEMFSNHGGAASYVISAATAKWLLKHSERMRMPVDLEMFDMDRRNIPKIKVYQWCSSPCIQDDLVGEVGFSSNIVDRYEYDGKASGLHQGLVFWLKTKLRPLYTCLYSFLLLPVGKQRKRIIWQGLSGS